MYRISRPLLSIAATCCLCCNIVTVDHQTPTALISFYSCPKTNAKRATLQRQTDLQGDVRVTLSQKLGGDFFARDNKGRELLDVAVGGDVERFWEVMDMGA